MWFNIDTALTISYLLAEILILAARIYALWLNYYLIKENHNPVNKVLMMLIFLIIIRGFRASLKFVFKLPEYIMNFIYLNSPMSTLHILDIITAMFGLYFKLYLLEYKEVYGIPFVVGFFMIAYAITVESMNLTSYVSVGSAIGTYIFQFSNAVKNNNGISFAIGMAGLMAIFDYIFADADMMGIFQLRYLFRFASIMIFILGLNSYWDEKVFFDRSKRKQIRSTWITTFVN